MNFRKIILLLSIFLILFPYVGDNDFWLHLRAGEIIVQERSLSGTDVISFTNIGKEWINHEWLAQVVFYLLYQAGGFLAITIFTALIGTAIFGVIIKGRKVSWTEYSFLFVLAYSLRPFIVPRPQIFAYFFLILLIFKNIDELNDEVRKIIFYYYHTEN